MRNVGTASTSAARTRRSSVAPAAPSVTDPPDAMYSERTPSIRNGVSAAATAMPHLEHAVEPQRTRMRVAAAAEDRGARAEPAHEDRQHGGAGERRRAEDEAKLAHPDGLIDEGAESGHEEKRRNCP